ncbi:aldose 1-epimerase family protein [Flavobacterium gilvum]|uniref:Aldose epimerase n=1 Tax=Flavobacterium gilvum TaxID=1492737 RepID=A0AAC9I6M4_9FLAO|nr:aldose 1-epimerase family protein [Flavobacterium gilvum]AOW10665.1 aldose epimerase [Flavobacterium gilvum]KFC57597.1 aldose 1-epimerase [Flavobacterium gilvum]
MITTISNSFLTAQIKHLGAELSSLKDNSNKEYIWNGNPDFWGKHSPVLFPIVGTLKNNSFQYKDAQYQLSRHGFAREMEFELIDKQENKSTFSLVSSPKTKEKYPFDFDLHLIYTLENKSLKIEYKVFNNGETKMPFSIGAHPAFDLPGDFENYSLTFEKEGTLNYYILEDGLISNTTDELHLDKNKLPLNYELFKNDALVFKNIDSKSITILEKSKPFLKVNYTDFPDLGIWTPNAPFICIEPWFGYSDTVDKSGDLFDKEGIQLLEPKAVFHSEFSIEIL